MILSIRQTGSPVLRVPCAAVTLFDDRLGHIARDMCDTLLAHHAAGLAANQVGFGLRMVALANEFSPPNPLVMVNPVVCHQSGEAEVLEWCLSLPGIGLPIRRATHIEVEWQTLTGAPARGTFTEWDARVVQHEIDHLNGILITDRYID
jgi:peptide deformylase